MICFDPAQWFAIVFVIGFLLGFSLTAVFGAYFKWLKSP